MNSITKFCINNHISKGLEDAFFAYCRSTYAKKYGLKNGPTMKFAIEKLNDNEVMDAWKDFVIEFKNFILNNSM